MEMARRFSFLLRLTDFRTRRKLKKLNIYLLLGKCKIEAIEVQ
jgi:hypothetical protein